MTLISPVSRLFLLPALFIFCSCEEKKAAADSDNGARTGRSHTGFSGESGTRTTSRLPDWKTASKKDGILNFSDANMENVANTLLHNPDEVRASLNTMGPGRNRREAIGTMLYGIAVNSALPAEAAVELLKIIDEDGYPEDCTAVFHSMNKIVGRVGPESSLTLLQNLRSKDLKTEVASAIGEILGKKGNVPNPKQFSNLDESSRISIYDSIGQELGASFKDVGELARLLENTNQSSKEGRALVQSALEMSERFEANSLVETAYGLSDTQIACQIFEIGVGEMIKDDPLKASDYLASHKPNLDPALYQAGVKRLVAYLDHTGDKNSLHLWQQELKN